MQNTKPDSNERIAYGRLTWVTLLAATIVVNVLIYFAASGMGFIPQSVLIPMPSGEHHLTVASVVVSSVVGAIGAAIVFAIIGLFAPRPVRLFRIVAIVVLVLSFAMPLTIPGAPVPMILSLEVMHVAAWAVIVGLLTTLVRQEDGKGSRN
jgi:hypothetical protein